MASPKFVKASKSINKHLASSGSRKEQKRKISVKDERVSSEVKNSDLTGQEVSQAALLSSVDLTDRSGIKNKQGSKLIASDNSNAPARSKRTSKSKVKVRKPSADFENIVRPEQIDESAI